MYWQNIVFVRKSSAVYDGADGALVPGRAFGPCQYVAESARPGQPVHPTSYILKIPCALLKILNFCGASLEL